MYFPFFICSLTFVSVSVPGPALIPLFLYSPLTDIPPVDYVFRDLLGKYLSWQLEQKPNPTVILRGWPDGKLKVAIEKTFKGEWKSAMEGPGKMTSSDASISVWWSEGSALLCGVRFCAVQSCPGSLTSDLTHLFAITPLWYSFRAFGLHLMSK